MEAIATPQEPRRRLHSIREVEHQANTSHATTWRLIKRGVLKTVKIGRRTFVTDDSLEQLIAQGAPKVGEAA
jgi:type VI protein secretion system component VasA